MTRRPARTDSCRSNRGFTLLEMVIVVVLLGILGITATSILYDPFSTAKNVNTANSDADKARYALERIARELREIKNAAGAFCFSITNASTINYRKADGDTTSCTTPAQSTITLASGAITLDGTTLANNVQSFSLSYDSATDSIQINLTVVDTSESTATSSNASVQRTRVFLRNTSS